MSDFILTHGYPSLEELKENGRFPSEARFQKGPVAVIECIQPIPCNPCEAACRFGAIKVGEPIINLPVLSEDACTGCGNCIAHCSGLAIFVVDKSAGDGTATVSFPYEYLPLPEKGQLVDAVARDGQVRCEGRVVRIVNSAANDHTPVITLRIPVEFADEVRSMRRLNAAPAVAPTEEQREVSLADPDDTLVCRCEEVTVGDIKRAIADGARTLTGIKRRTRAGMGLCQGRTCQKLIERMLASALSEAPSEIAPDTVRPPMVPITIGVLGGEDDAE